MKTFNLSRLVCMGVLSTLLFQLLFTISSISCNDLISIQSFQGDRCSGTVTHSFYTFSSECTKLAPFAYKMEQCVQGSYNTKICLDDQCKVCVQKEVKPGECIAEESVKIQCTDLSGAEIVPTGAIAKLAFYGIEDTTAKCNASDLFNIIYLMKDSCQKIEDSLYIRLKVNGTKATANFFKDGACKEATEFSRETTLQGGKCFIPEFIPMPNVASMLTIF